MKKFRYLALKYEYDIINERLGSDGYIELRIRRGNGRTKWFKRYVLVAETYIGKIPFSYDVHHKDFNKLNDRPSNLEIITKGEHLERHNVGSFSDGVLIPGNNPRNTGKAHSEKTKLQMSKMAIGNRNADESIRCLDRPEWTKKISKSLRGNSNRTGRKDVTVEAILKLKSEDISLREVARRLDCSLTCVLSRLQQKRRVS